MPEKTFLTLEIVKILIGIITGSVAGSLITLWHQRSNEKYYRKHLKVDRNISQFTFPKIKPEGEVELNLMKVEYKGQLYNYLSLCTIKVHNVGLVKIENQEVVFSFPKYATIIDKFFNSKPILLNYSLDEKSYENRKQIMYTFSKLEKKDAFEISYLIDSAETDTFDMFPRELDDVEYNYFGPDSLGLKEK